MDQVTFLERLRRSKLLSAEEISQIADRHAGVRASDLARALVAEKLLTPYQAEQIYAGNTRGFRIGPYCILAFLGEGSAGAVFRAEHSTLGRIAAIKVFKKAAFDSEEAYHFFQREVQATGLLNHPNLVTAYDAGKARGIYYLVMEYVDGPSVRKIVRRDGPLPVSLACEIARQTALGLQYAHERGMVHRDIKPSNLLVRNAPGWNSARGPKSEPVLALASPPTPVVKVLDFGLARLGHSPGVTVNGNATLAVQSGVMVGTADYISPEQADNIHTVDIRSDLYSLGCTLYFILSGEVPFPGTTALEKLVKRLTEEPVPLRQRRPEIPPAVAGIVQCLMARNPGARFQTPAALAEALAPCCAPENAKPSSAEVATCYNLKPLPIEIPSPARGGSWNLPFPEKTRLSPRHQIPCPALLGAKRTRRGRGGGNGRG
jgi:serine/threonine-protein kinase